MLPEALNRKFGIEFEYRFPGLGNTPEGVADAIRHIVPVSYPTEDYYNDDDDDDDVYDPDDVRLGRADVWTLGHDSGGVEVRTPPSTHRDWAKIGQVLDVIRPHGRWSRENGTHIHMDATDCSNKDRMSFVHWWVSLESLFMTMVHRSRRQNGYCYPLESVLFTQERDWNYEQWRVIREQMFNEQRYNWILSRLGRQAITPQTYHNTIEVRLHHATLNRMRIKQWIWTMQVLLWHAKHTTLSRHDVDNIRALPNAEKMNILSGIIIQHAGSRRSKKIINHLNERVVRYA